jgi:cytochrome c553
MESIVRLARIHIDGYLHRAAGCIGLLLGLLVATALPALAAAPRVPETMAERVAACVACHGKEGRATRDGFFPRIAGKPAGYLYNQLVNFREGRRQNPAMTYMVEHLSDAYLMEIAQYFSNLHPAYPAPQLPDVSPAALERGRKLALSGDESKKIPACVACHGQALTGAAPSIPGLAGLPPDYLRAQFGAWRNGGRHAAAPDCMGEIANRLSIDEINAVSAWLAAQTVQNDAAPPLSVKLPMSCGGVSPASPVSQ